MLTIYQISESADIYTIIKLPNRRLILCIFYARFLIMMADKNNYSSHTIMVIYFFKHRCTKYSLQME